MSIKFLSWCHENSGLSPAEYMHKYKGSKGGSESSQTTTQTVEVPEWLESELQYGVEESRRLYDQGAPEYYEGQTYADFTPEQIQALEATKQRAIDGSPIVQGAQDLTQRTLDGEFLEGNPYLDQMLAKLSADAGRSVMGQFSASGRMGSGANTRTATQAITEATLPFLFQNYQSERQNQITAAQMASGLADYDYRDINMLATAGDAYQAQDQLAINEDVSRYNYEQNSEANWLNDYLNRINSSSANNLVTQTNVQETDSGGGGFGGMLGTALTLGGEVFGGFGGNSGGMGGETWANGDALQTAGQAASLFAAFSDERLKQNIVKVREENGFNIYRFNYKETPQETYEGVIAQEVMQSNPEAVIKDESGFYKVNYKMIGVDMKLIEEKEGQ